MEGRRSSVQRPLFPKGLAELAARHFPPLQNAILRYSVARPRRNRIARSVWSAAYPAALAVADESVMRALRAGQRKAAGYAALQTLRDIAARERSRDGEMWPVRLHKKSSRNETISRDTDRLRIYSAQRASLFSRLALLFTGKDGQFYCYATTNRNFISHFLGFDIRAWRNFYRADFRD